MGLLAMSERDLQRIEILSEGDGRPDDDSVGGAFA